MSSKYVMVDTVSMFRMRYVIEVPEECDCTPEEYAMDTVTCEEAREFTQDYMGETIVSTREVTLEEALAQYRKDEPTLGAAWNDDTIVKNTITPIGYDEKEQIAREEANWSHTVLT
jgi:hypothetical protein